FLVHPFYTGFPHILLICSLYNLAVVRFVHVMIHRHVDCLVIGSGIAGLSFALIAAERGKVLIVTKSNDDESNTKYAQVGVAAVVDKSDSFEKHIIDTQIAGDGLCHVNIVENVVKEAPERIKELIDYGTNFDKVDEEHYDLAREGGH